MKNMVGGLGYFGVISVCVVGVNHEIDEVVGRGSSKVG